MCDNIANGQPRVLSVLGSTGGGGGGECCPPANVIIASNVLSTNGNVIAGNIISQDGTFTGNLYVAGALLGNIIFTTANYLTANAAVLSFQTANGASLNVSSLEFTNQILPTNLPASGVTAGQYGNFSNVSSIQVDQYGRVTQASNVAILSSQWTNIDGNVAYQNGVSIGSLTNPPPGSNLYVRGTANIDTLNVTSLYANSAIIFGGKTLNVWGISNLADLVAVTGNVLNLSSLASNTLVGNVSSFAAVSGNVLSLSSLASNTLVGNVASLNVVTGNVLSLSSLTSNTLVGNVASLNVAMGNVLSLSSLASNTLVGNVATLWAANIYTTNISGFIGSQWVGASGDPIYYLPHVGIGTSGTSSNLTVAGNVYVSDSLETPLINTSVIQNISSITAYSNNSVNLQYNVLTTPPFSGDSTWSITSIDNHGVSLTVDNKVWNFNPSGSTQFPNYNFPNYTGAQNQVLVDATGTGNLQWSNIVQSKISNIYSLSLSSDSTLTLPGGITFYNNIWNYPTTSPTIRVGSSNWTFANDGVTYFPNYRFPSGDGMDGQVLATNGYGVINFKYILNLSKLYVDTTSYVTKTTLYTSDGSDIVLSPVQSLTGNAMVSVPSNLSTNSLLIKNNGAGGVTIQSNNYQWNFGTNGNATFPGGIILASSNITTGNIVSLSSLTANLVTANVNSLVAVTGNVLNLSSLLANAVVGNVSSLVAVTGNVLNLSSLAANVAVGNVSSLASVTGNVLSLSSLLANVATGNVLTLSSLVANVATGNVNSLVAATGNVLNLSSLAANVATANVLSLSSLAANVLSGNVSSLTALSLSSLTANVLTGNVNSLASVSGNVLNLSSLIANVATGNVNSLVAATGNVLRLSSLVANVATGNVSSLASVTGNVLNLSSLVANVAVGNVSSLASVTGNVLNLSSLASNVATGNVLNLSSLEANVVNLTATNITATQYTGNLTGWTQYFTRNLGNPTTSFYVLLKDTSTSGSVIGRIFGRRFNSPVRTGNISEVVIEHTTGGLANYSLRATSSNTSQTSELVSVVYNTVTYIALYVTTGSVSDYASIFFEGYETTPNDDILLTTSVTSSTPLPTSQSNYYILNSDVGIGTNIPRATLEVDGNLYVSNALTTINLFATNCNVSSTSSLIANVATGNVNSLASVTGNVLNLSSLTANVLTGNINRIVAVTGNVLSLSSLTANVATENVSSLVAVTGNILNFSSLTANLTTGNVSSLVAVTGNVLRLSSLVANVATGNVNSLVAMTGNVLNLSSLTANLVTGNVSSLVAVTGNVLSLSSLTANLGTGNVSSLTTVTGNVLNLSSLTANVATGNVSSLAVVTGNVTSLSSQAANVATGNVSSLAVVTGNVTTLSSLVANVATGNVSSLASVTGNVLNLSSLAANVATGNVSSLAVVTGNVTSLSSLVANVAVGNVSSLASVTGNVLNLSSLAANVAVGNVSSLASVTGNVMSLSSQAANVAVGNVSSLAVVTGNVTSLSSQAANVLTGNLNSLAVVSGNVTSLSSLVANVLTGNLNSLAVVSGNVLNLSSLVANVATGNVNSLTVSSLNVSSANLSSLSVSNIYSLAPVGNTYLTGNIVISGNVYSSLGELGSGGGLYFSLNSAIAVPASYTGGTYGTAYQLAFNPSSGFTQSGASTMISVTANGTFKFSATGPYLFQGVFLGSTDTVTGMAVGSNVADVHGTDQNYLYRYTSLVTQNPTEIFQVPLNVTDTSKYYYLDLFMLNPTGLQPTDNGQGGTYVYVTPLVAGGGGTGGSVIVQPTQWLTASNPSNIYFPNSVGVGATNPQYNLDVSGDIRATGNVYSANHVLSGRTTSYSASVLDYYIGMSNGQTVILPLGSTVTTGKQYIIKDESGLAGTFVGYRVTVTASPHDLIDGQNSLILAINYGAVNVIWTGSFWSIY